MRNILLAACVAVAAGAGATMPESYQGKSIYIPVELRDNDFHSPESKWSFGRMLSTDNVAVFWTPGFGNNIAEAPDLDGHNMKVDLANLIAKLEGFYNYFYNDLAFVKPGTKADKYKMMVMLDYSLEGTAYGGDYDSTIGALWIAPNRVQDKKLNCIAHELGHSFQSQIACDGEGESWGGAGIFEMASQWMLWQVNPDWPTDENYHLNAFRDGTHKAFLHIDNIYRSPYVLEMWSEKHGLPVIAELFRQGKVGEDPVMTYKRMFGMTQKEFNDEMFAMQRRFVNWDIDRARENMAPYRNLWHTAVDKIGGNSYRVAASNAPENYGFNAIALVPPAPGKTATVKFKGEAGIKGYYTPEPKNAGWRYGFVAVDTDGNSIYGDMHSSPKGTLSFTAPADRVIVHLWLFVMGAPQEHRRNVDGPDNPGDHQWPYSFRLNGTEVRR